MALAIVIAAISLATLYVVATLWPQLRSETRTLSTVHFIIIYRGIRSSNAAEVADRLEKNYIRILAELNVTVVPVIKVFIHPTRRSFYRAVGFENHRASGTSMGPAELHVLWTNWLNHIFPDHPTKTAVHEFTHCVQLCLLIEDAKTRLLPMEEERFNAVFEKEFKSKYPRWLWEALSVYQAREVNRFAVKFKMRYQPTLESLNQGNMIYQVGYTIIEYIIAKWGVAKLHPLICSYGNISLVLNVSPVEFEQQWRIFVRNKYR